MHAVDRLETGAVDATLHLPDIAGVTHRPPEWFVEPPPETSGMVSVPDGRATSSTDVGVTGRRNLVLGAVVLLVTVRFFTEIIPIFPRAANFVDIPIFLGLAAAAMAIPQRQERQRRHYLFLGAPAVAFLGLCILSAVANPGRVQPGPVLVFIYGFLAPVGIYAATYGLWPAGNARSLSRLLVGLGIVQLVVVALIDLPRFIASSNPDVVSGTFGTNAYQLVYFLLIFTALLAGIFSVEPKRRVARIAPLLIAASFATVLLAQYRALLATTAVTVVVVGILLGRRARGVAIGAAAVAAFAIMFSYVASNYPFLRLGSTAAVLADDPRFYAAERLKAARPVSRLYKDKPLAAVLGTGPGTFSSRAWQTFAKAGSTSQSNVAGSYVATLTGSTTYETDVSRTYIQSELARGAVIEGSRAVTSPHSSYLALLAEVGVLGFALVVGMYVTGTLRAGHIAIGLLRRPIRGDPLPALALATTIAFLTLLQLGLLENWLEVTRVTFIAWMMLAVVAKELDSRPARR
ncbi:hypothetical protein BH18ACT13_BH18ACT13_01800 [soil metagenome]